jgi:hypothetical protein
LYLLARRKPAEQPPAPVAESLQRSRMARFLRSA